MNPTHLHLLLNHVPVVAVPIGAALLAWALLRRSSEGAKTAMLLLAVTGVVTLIVYLTGEPAEELVEGLPGVSETLIEAHEEAALIAAIASALVGAIAVSALVAFRGRAVPRWLTWVSLLIALATTATLGWTANLGGQIRHTEIRSSTTTETQQDPGDRHEREPGEIGG